MRTSLAIITLASCVALASCASKTSITYELFVFPQVGATATKSVGDKLLEQGFGQLGPSIETLNDATIGKLFVPKGIYPYYSENGTGIWFYKDPYYFYLNKSDRKLCVDGKDCIDVEHRTEKRLIPGTLQKDSFQQTLLYNGKIGNKITLAYREFSDNVARPAFSNSVEYDLSESSIVGYKGARLEIVKATNTELTYRVISGFSQ